MERKARRGGAEYQAKPREKQKNLQPPNLQRNGGQINERETRSEHTFALLAEKMPSKRARGQKKATKDASSSGSSASEKAKLCTGLRLGRWELDKVIGAGAFSEVWLATHRGEGSKSRSRVAMANSAGDGETFALKLAFID